MIKIKSEEFLHPIDSDWLMGDPRDFVRGLIVDKLKKEGAIKKGGKLNIQLSGVNFYENIL